MYTNNSTHLLQVGYLWLCHRITYRIIDVIFPNYLFYTNSLNVELLFYFHIIEMIINS